MKLTGEQSNIAVDLAHLCERLSVRSDELGGTFLARQFNVDAFSSEFFEILSVIIRSTITIEKALTSSTVHPSVVANANQHLLGIRAAFNQHGLVGNWKNHGANQVSALHSDPILAISGSLPDFNYNKPDTEAAAAILDDAHQLLKWLETHEIEESDFIRLCLIDGLKRFIFRVEKLDWLGWSYAVEGLKEVMGAYLALDRGFADDAQPMTLALMQKVNSKLARAFSYVGKGRDLNDDAGFLLAVFQGAIWPGSTFIAGLIASP